ncbi:multidrug transporter [Halopseudomonas pertucinogena]|uniref:Multidrug transporter n=1 Tax=Halopseudomonas pertucinogena TaxID=86175 RepID=A0ABQ2CRD3_9GAMM|nr:multidrug transporter [Halopseudomonas pertucinogena]GGJ01540.1 hypothetical protein GCM10009083_17900 [Halopseudomonas pertucinogena]
MPLLGIILSIIWLVLLVRFPRAMLPASAILVAIALLLGAAVGIWQWQHERQVSRLEISVEYRPEACEFGRPLQVTIHNTGSRTASWISWQLQAVQPGYNTNLLDLGVTRSTYRLDRPLHADERQQECHAVPPLRSGFHPADLQYQADHIRAEFQH